MRDLSQPHFAQNGPITPKIPGTLSPLDMSTYTEFGRDRLCFAVLIPERLNLCPKKSIQYRLSAYKNTVPQAPKIQNGSEDKELNQARSTPDTVDCLYHWAPL